MLSGTAISRVVCAHFIYDALNAMLLTDALNAPLPIQIKYNLTHQIPATMPRYVYDEVTDTPDLDEARVVYGKLVDGIVMLKTYAGLTS